MQLSTKLPLGLTVLLSSVVVVAFQGIGSSSSSVRGWGLPKRPVIAVGHHHHHLKAQPINSNNNNSEQQQQQQQQQRVAVPHPPMIIPPPAAFVRNNEIDRGKAQQQQQLHPPLDDIIMDGEERSDAISPLLLRNNGDVIHINNGSTDSTEDNANGILDESSSQTGQQLPLETRVQRILAESAAERERAARLISATSVLLERGKEEEADDDVPAEEQEEKIQVIVSAASSRLDQKKPHQQDDKERPWTTILLGGKPVDYLRTWFPTGKEEPPVTENNFKNPFGYFGSNGRDTTSSSSPWRGGTVPPPPKSPDDAFVSMDIKPGVPAKEIQGAALAGFCAAAAVLTAGHDDGFFDYYYGSPLTLLAPVVAAYLAVTRGTVGDLSRAVGELAWDAANLAVALYKEIDFNKGTVPAEVLELSWHAAALAARGTRRRAREAAAFATEYRALQKERERKTRAERNARGLLKARLDLEARARSRRGAAAEMERAAGAARQERERRFAERRQKDTVHVKAREDLIRYRFEMEAIKRRNDLLAKREAQKRVVLQMQLEMEKTAKKRTQGAEEAQLAEERAVTEKVSVAEQADMFKLKDKIRRKLTSLKSKEVWAAVARRVNQVKRFLDNCGREILATRYTLLQRAAVYLVAASAPLFAMMQQQNADDATMTAETKEV